MLPGTGTKAYTRHRSTKQRNGHIFQDSSNLWCFGYDLAMYVVHLRKRPSKVVVPMWSRKVPPFGAAAMMTLFFNLGGKEETLLRA